MNQDLQYLIAMQKSADMRGTADQEGLAHGATAMRVEDRGETSAAQTIVRLQLRGSGRGRLRIRRAIS